MYRVLWIDDEFDKLTELVGHAIDNDITLVGFSSVEAGFEHLRQNLSRYDAILLDAKSFEKKGQQSGTESIRALSEARDQINALRYEKYFPYFVLTGQKGLQDDETFGQQYTFFRKGSLAETEALFAAIKTAVDEQPESQLRSRYQPAFAACTDQFVSEKAGRLLAKVLAVVEKPQSNHDDDTQFNNLRKIVEGVFHAAQRFGILPAECIPRGEVNLANCTEFLSGKRIQVSSQLYAVPRSALMPKLLGQATRVFLDLTSSGSHEDGPATSSNLLELRQRVKTPYLLAALTYQVMDLLVWFKDFVSDPNALSTHRNAWTLPTTITPETYVHGTVTNVRHTAAVFVATDTNEQAHIHKSQIDAHGLNEGMKIEAVLKANNRDATRKEVKTVRLLV
ncbi:hypothetical protein ACFP2F_11810 [Hymenobacter artigasi]|uniref:Response regulator n=1 Tax=Hymenobacter artigasi TaxID=2719616 RepID=A0ABX1HGV3_9BACT|nr:hypothetical protein [Hymenobacter artigasi]NKI89488.1 hypothetical protein [Hymenobacter artigasi]